MSNLVHQQNQQAWALTARHKYADDVADDVAFIRTGQTNLLPMEVALLQPIVPHCQRVIHLQCSHGLDALSLWQMGAEEVIGVDISAEMLALAQQKSDLLGAPARWVHADILATPHDLDGTADLVYTGKGALPWMMDLDAWAQVVARLLKPGGWFYVLEGHPLNWVWEPEVNDFRLRTDGGDYFANDPRVNRTFPAAVVQRACPGDATAPQPVEHQWTLAQTITALLDAGLTLRRFEEYPTHFWPEFGNIPTAGHDRLPHTFALLMSKDVLLEKFS